MQIDDFLLLSGEDIPLTTVNLIVHNPSLQEIVNIFLYENDFLTGFEFLFFSKEKLDKQEQQMLSALSDFEILLTLLNIYQENKQGGLQMQKQLQCLQKFLSLLFKYYDNITYKETKIILNKDEHVYFIDEKVFEELKTIVRKIFPFKTKTGLEFNPQSKRAQEIAEKIKKGRERVAKQKQQEGISESLFEKYISILSIGLQIPVYKLYQCTIFQLLNMFNRFEKKEVYDVYLKAQLAGATGMKEVDHWMM